MLFSIKIQFKIIETSSIFCQFTQRVWESALIWIPPTFYPVKVEGKSEDILCIILSFGLRQLSANSLQKFCNSPLFPETFFQPATLESETCYFPLFPIFFHFPSWIVSTHAILEPETYYFPFPDFEPISWALHASQVPIINIKNYFPYNTD